MGLRGPKPGEKKGGRVKGTPNKLPAFLKEAILAAATAAGDKMQAKIPEHLRAEGLVHYLTSQAVANPNSFMALLGKVLPLTLAGDPNNPLEVVQKIERAIIPEDRWQDPADSDGPSIRSVN